jgi:hypothetical protein
MAPMPHAPTRQKKITLGEMRSSGVRGLLMYCADYRCAHAVRISGDRWPDHFGCLISSRCSCARRAAEGAPISGRTGTANYRGGARVVGRRNARGNGGYIRCRVCARRCIARVDFCFASRSASLAVPELTRSADIKLNTRLRLPPAVAIVSSPQLRGVPTATTEAARSGVAAYQEGAAAPPNCVWIGKLNDAATQLGSLDRDGLMLDNFARNDFEFCFCR